MEQASKAGFIVFDLYLAQSTRNHSTKISILSKIVHFEHEINNSRVNFRINHPLIRPRKPQTHLLSLDPSFRANTLKKQNIYYKISALCFVALSHVYYLFIIMQVPRGCGSLPGDRNWHCGKAQRRQVKESSALRRHAIPWISTERIV